MKRLIRVGTRESSLAIAQSNWVINEIKRKFPELEFELVGIKTKGDAILDRRLDKIGGKGLFIKELESALLEGTVDFAVHSMKDMPSEIAEGLTIAAVSGREDPRDALVTLDGRRLDGLAEDSVVGTSSLRREVQLLDLKPGFKIKTLRGNVITRLKKLSENEYDAIILAMAGLKRLGMEDRCVQCFSVEEMIPAVGQGALGIETRKDYDAGYLRESIHDEDASLAVRAERAYMKRLDGGCSKPIAAHAVVVGKRMKIYGMYAFDETSGVTRATVEGSSSNAEALGMKLADSIIKKSR